MKRTRDLLAAAALAAALLVPAVPARAQGPEPVPADGSGSDGGAPAAPPDGDPTAPPEPELEPSPDTTPTPTPTPSSEAVPDAGTSQEALPGFVDGLPVGGDDQAAGSAGILGSAGIANQPIYRYFGRIPYEAIRTAVAATPRPCSVTNDGLTALVLAPIFGESSAATSPSTSPSPMTLSRYDEWTGVYDGNTNRNANYGLYAFRNPYTPYPRAYWHPGIGIWQYDSAGVGAPFNAVQRMNVGTMAADVAASMITRYCNATGTDLQRRYAAWQPWQGANPACTHCESSFQALFTTRSASAPSGFTHLQLVEGVGLLGGTVQRTCSIAGGANFPCWYVDPGQAQGSAWWATGLPLNDGNPTSGTTPLSYPFYVFTRDGREERHWIRADTGYAVNVSATRVIGQNARPRNNQPLSGLTWSSVSHLCDVTAQRGLCDLAPPTGMQLGEVSVGGLYHVVVGDFDGDGNGDVFWYGPGSAPDYVWWGNGNGTFTSTNVSVSGNYAPVVGDLDGDGRDDIVWPATSGPSYIWWGRAARSFTSTSAPFGAGTLPLLLDLDGDGAKELFAYGPGSLPDRIHDWNGTGWASRDVTVHGRYTPLVGDFDGDGREDIFWYGPGAVADSLWRFGANGTYTATNRPVHGTYTPLVGDFDGDGRTDIFWYGPGAAPDSLWYGGAGGNFVDAGHTVSVAGSYYPVVADLGAQGRDDILWYGPGRVADTLWRWGTNRSITAHHLAVNGSYFPIIGAFGAGGTDGVLWYAPGTAPDYVWYR